MNFQQLSEALPNGFHDAEVLRFEMDYVRRTLQFHITIWIGELSNEKSHDVYRPACLTLHDVGFFVIEAPDKDSHWKEAGPIMIDSGEGQPEQSETILPAPTVGTSVSWLYVEEFNRFILFSAGNAELEWTGPETNRALEKKG